MNIDFFVFFGMYFSLVLLLISTISGVSFLTSYSLLPLVYSSQLGFFSGEVSNCVSKQRVNIEACYFIPVECIIFFALYLNYVTFDDCLARQIRMVEWVMYVKLRLTD